MSDDGTTLCPYCGGTLAAGESTCPACQENLAALIRLEKRHLLLYNEALDAARAGEWEQAILALQLSLREREDFGPACKLLAKVYAAAGQWDKAREAVHRAQELLPDDATLAELLRDIDKGSGRRRSWPPVVNLVEH